MQHHPEPEWCCFLLIERVMCYHIPIVAELIDPINVCLAEKQYGMTNQQVVIYSNCVGAFDVPDRRKIPEADVIMEMKKA